MHMCRHDLAQSLYVHWESMKCIISKIMIHINHDLANFKVQYTEDMMKVWFTYILISRLMNNELRSLIAWSKYKRIQHSPVARNLISLGCKYRWGVMIRPPLLNLICHLMVEAVVCDIHMDVEMNYVATFSSLSWRSMKLVNSPSLMKFHLDSAKLLIRQWSLRCMYVPMYEQK